jgi:hypothetical protein
MGSQLAKAVSDNWGHLPAGPYKLLMRMALYSLDSSTNPETPAGHYWKGWRDLSAALGRKLPPADDDSPQAVSRRKTLKREVLRYTADLVRLGAVVKAVDNPGAGTRQVWKLTL